MPNSSASMPGLSWVQGMRPVREGVIHPLSWQELLFRRLTGRWNAPSGDTTLTAEAVLGFPVPMTYFYVGRCVPSFGSNTVASRLDDEANCEGPFTTPFDTGALAKGGKISVLPALEDGQRGAFVTGHTYTKGDYVEPMTAWLDAAFESPEDYPDGKPPMFHAVSDIALEDCDGDSRVWTWEGRIPAIDYPELPLSVQHVFFSEGTRQPYLDWVRNTRLVSMSERRLHMREVYAYSDEVVDAAEGMLEFLKGRLAP